MEVMKRYCKECSCYKSVFLLDELDKPVCPECGCKLDIRLLNMGVGNND